MGMLGTLGTIVLAASQKESSHGTGSLWIIFETVRHSNKHIFEFEFLR